MNFKYLFFIFFVFCAVGQVKCDCDGYLKCLGGFVHDFFNSDQNVTGKNYTEVVNIENGNNDTNVKVNFFDLTQIGKTLTDALTDVTSLIKDEIKGVFDIKHDTDVYKEVDNHTEIHVRAFSLHNLGFNGTETIKLPEIIMNNFTEFNNELNALKVELEKNLQDQIEEFISKILENDTLDWEEVTQGSADEDITTTLRTILNEGNDAPTTVKYDDDDSTTTKSIENSEASIIQTTRDDNNVTTTKDTKNLTTTTPSTTKREESKIEVTTKVVEKVDQSTTEVPKLTKNNSNTTKSITTTTTTKSAIKVETTSKPEPTIKVEEQKLEAQTKTPIDYKLIENLQENEISNEDSPYYDTQDDNSTDYPIIDYVDIYKDTTNEPTDYVPTEPPVLEAKNDTDNFIGNENVLTNEEQDNNNYTNDTSNPLSILPWIATIFVRNETTNQFDYYCDGTILSQTVVLTAGRCVHRDNQTVKPDDVLVFLGKRSLQVNGGEERVFRTTSIKVHDNITVNDLAALTLEDAVEFNERIQPACLAGSAGEEGVTTAWDYGITIVRFVDQNVTCENEADNTFCATFGNDVPLCPSYGGAYASKQADSWCLRGIRTAADPSYRGFCIQKTVTYTDLNKYSSWLDSLLGK